MKSFLFQNCDDPVFIDFMQFTYNLVPTVQLESAVSVKIKFFISIIFVAVIFFSINYQFTEKTQGETEIDFVRKKPINVFLPILEGKNEVPVFSYFRTDSLALEAIHKHPPYLHIAIWKDGTVLWTPLELSDAIFKKAEIEIPNRTSLFYSSPNCPIYIGKISENEVLALYQSFSTKDISIFEYSSDNICPARFPFPISTEIVCMFMGKKIYYFDPVHLQSIGKNDAYEQWKKIKDEVLRLIPNEKEPVRETVLLQYLRFNTVDCSISHIIDERGQFHNGIPFNDF